MEQFAQNIKDLEVTTVDRARQAIADKETATFFVGRKTCPYCRKFADTKAHIFFINSEEASELEKLQAFRSEYSIPTVPGFVHVQDGQVSVRCDSSMTADKIKAFANL